MKKRIFILLFALIFFAGCGRAGEYESVEDYSGYGFVSLYEYQGNVPQEAEQIITAQNGEQSGQQYEQQYEQIKQGENDYYTPTPALPQEEADTAIDIYTIPYFGNRENFQLSAAHALAFAEAVQDAQIDLGEWGQFSFDEFYPVFIDVNGDGVPLLLLVYKGAATLEWGIPLHPPLLFGFFDGEIQRIAEFLGIGIMYKDGERLLSVGWITDFGGSYDFYRVGDGAAEFVDTMVFVADWHGGEPHGEISINGVEICPEEYWEVVDNTPTISLVDFNHPGNTTVAPALEGYLTRSFTRGQLVQIFIDYITTMPEYCEVYDLAISRRYSVFENYFAVGIDDDELLAEFDAVHNMGTSGEGGWGFALWAVGEPLERFEVLRVFHGACECCRDFYSIPGDPTFKLSMSATPLEAGQAVVLHNYVGHSHSPTFAVAFDDSGGRRRYVGILRCLYGRHVPFVLMEFALEFNLDDDTLPRATYPNAFPRGVPLPQYFLFGGHEVRSTIRNFDLWGISLGDEGIAPLRYMRYLHSAALMENEISDISPLAGLANLHHLDLRDNYVEDISPLAGLVNLQRLNLALTQVSDLTPLAGLTNLRHLDLRGNPDIYDLSPLAGLPYLEWLNVEGTGVIDFSYVEHVGSVLGRTSPRL